MAWFIIGICRRCRRKEGGGFSKGFFPLNGGEFVGICIDRDSPGVRVGFNYGKHYWKCRMRFSFYHQAHQWGGIFYRIMARNQMKPACQKKIPGGKSRCGMKKPASVHIGYRHTYKTKISAGTLEPMKGFIQPVGWTPHFLGDLCSKPRRA